MTADLRLLIFRQQSHTNLRRVAQRISGVLWEAAAVMEVDVKGYMPAKDEGGRSAIKHQEASSLLST